MNTTVAVEMVLKIQRLAQAGDFEAAHILERELWLQVLEHTRDGFGDERALAGIAISTLGIEFKRAFS